MGATRAATALNKLIQAATAREVVLGGGKLTDAPGNDKARPYFRLKYQLLDEPTTIPGRRRGLLTVYAFGQTEVEAWFEASKLTDALGLKHGNAMPSPAPGLADYALAQGWEALPDPSEGGLVACAIEFHYYP